MIIPSDEPVPARDRTRERLYYLIRSGAATSRSALVEATGLSRSTVNSAVTGLIRTGRVIEAGEEPKGVGSGSGRPATTLRAAPGEAIVGAIDFGHDRIAVALGDGTGQCIAEDSVDTDVDLRAHEAMDQACELLIGLAGTLGIGAPSAVAAGIPGPLDSRTGLVCSATILSSWVGLNPAEELSRRLGTAAHAENDALLGALGEQRLGAGRGHSNVFYIRATAGLGAGLILDGRLYRGATGIAGEIGHTAVPGGGGGEPCRCGRRGCLETVVSVGAVLQRIRHSHPGVAPDEITVSQPADAVTARIMAEVGATLGDALAMFCNLLNPSVLVLGGELGASGPSFVDSVRMSLLREAQPATGAGLDVVPAGLGVRAELVGALQAAAELVR